MAVRVLPERRLQVRLRAGEGAPERVRGRSHEALDAGPSAIQSPKHNAKSMKQLCDTHRALRSQPRHAYAAWRQCVRWRHRPMPGRRPQGGAASPAEPHLARARRGLEIVRVRSGGVAVATEQVAHLQSGEGQAGTGCGRLLEQRSWTDK